MDRRTFLYTGAILVGTPPLVGCRPWLRRSETPEVATDHHRETLLAMAETFVPSSDGSPGARECDPLATILDPAFPVLGYLSELVSDVDDWCFVRHFGKRFVDLPPAGREQALEERMGLRGRVIQSWYRPVYEGVLALTKLSFFGGLSRRVGTTFTGFPGPSAGYAPGSAAGVHRGDGDHVVVAGEGDVSSLRLTALAPVDAPRLARLRLTAPDGRPYEVTVPPATIATVLVDDHPVASDVGYGPAAGTWKLSAPDGSIAAGVSAWWLSLRTHLDDPLT